MSKILDTNCINNKSSLVVSLAKGKSSFTAIFKIKKHFIRFN